MKKTILTLQFALLLFLTANAQIVITEVMFNPPPSGTDTLEYIELYNNSGSSVDISGWHFTEGVTFTFPAATSLAANAYVVITENEAYFSARFPGVTTFQWDGALTNTGEDIELTTSDSSMIVDYFDYTGANLNPLLNGGGASLVLCDPNSDNSMLSNWQAATTPTGIFIAGTEIIANPGAAAGCSLLAANDNNVVASGESVVLDVLSNDILTSPLTGPVVIVATPAQGSATVNPDNTVTYMSPAGFCGTAQFEYQICDNSGCDTAIVSINVKCYAAYAIAQVIGNDANGEADSLGVDCELQGTVYGVNLRPVNNNQPSLLFTLIDDNGDGIAVSSLSGDFGYTVQEKDKVTVRGTIGQFNGLIEIQPDYIVKNSANNPLLAPTLVTTLDESTESRLVKLTNMHFVDPAEWTTGVGSSGFNVRAVSDDHPLDTILIRIDRDVETYNAPVPSEPFDLTGIGGQFDPTSPYNTGYQVLPRYNPDISTLSAVKQADFSALVSMTPNPASEQVLIRMEAPFRQISIFNATGTLVRHIRQPALTEQVTVSQLPAGTYFVQFEKDGAVWTARFMKI
ncbi:MAG: lamin tail domain-containing protein [Lewinellaceae bacterium]|nr:lamin tail domain-containing protein [Saprospiraceae bacterium]MCB9307984.1 lamin tail domain-containing protein [Lewinellaceae bacterium]MCB9354459.1 lamin tail domain-containing protein [Lewinellaceae bacterium]